MPLSFEQASRSHALVPPLNKSYYVPCLPTMIRTAGGSFKLFGLLPQRCGFFPIFAPFVVVV